MNKARRTKLHKAIELLEQVNSILEDCNQEENEYYDNMPESFQSGEKGDKAQQAISSIDDAYNQIEDTISFIEDAIEQ